MGLSEQLVAEFVKVTNDSNNNKPTESTVFGTTVEHDGRIFVRIDGSDLLTPVSQSTEVKPDDRVMVVIKDHTATVAGYQTTSAARSETVKEQGGKISEFETAMAYKVTTDDLEAVNAAIENLKATTAKIQNAEIIYAEIESLQAKFATLEHVNAKDIEAITATIESIEAKFGDFDNITAEDLEVINAEITNLKGYTADFTYVSADVLDAIKANIKELEVEKLDVTWGNINFADIDIATIGRLFTESGIIENLTTENGYVSGELVGVTIKGDLIEAATLKADRLVVKGSDGNYYALNTNFDGLASVTPVEEDKIHGSVMVANSITADKIVATDLIAFGATIAGFHLEGKEDNKPGAIYSDMKESVDSPDKGIYLDTEGQVAFGDELNHFKYYKDADGNFKMAISAQSILFGTYSGNKKFTLDDQGVTVDGVSDDGNVPTKTNISNNGMTVYANNEEKLKADNEGVAATDLHAKTYLIIGGNSRFENYDNNRRTGCFWIGG